MHVSQACSNTRLGYVRAVTSRSRLISFAICKLCTCSYPARRAASLIVKWLSWIVYVKFCLRLLTKLFFFYVKHRFIFKYYEIIVMLLLWGQSWRRGTKRDCKTEWLWVRSPLEEMKYLLKFIFPFLRSGVEAKARRWVLPLNTQCLQNLAESGDRSVLTIGSLCLPCFVRDTAWS